MTTSTPAPTPTFTRPNAAAATASPPRPDGLVRVAQAFLIGDGPLAEGTELFALARSSPLGSQDYVTRFFHTGNEIT
ncbi:hypothetical protein Ahu01nite_018080 [Winogradskya humida]|uniref:Uncharacterized protein n=1 Tax=Winogradskya humida TaxID=113566 RepID=A0ABQ3ZJE1_9ACTN|nr:hypothetical protein Ahu01nite_018080 [Actinoplanes humidus]